MVARVALGEVPIFLGVQPLSLAYEMISQHIISVEYDAIEYNRLGIKWNRIA